MVQFREMWRNGISLILQIGGAAGYNFKVSKFQSYSSERCGAMVIVRRDVAQWLEFREMWHNGYS